VWTALCGGVWAQAPGAAPGAVPLVDSQRQRESEGRAALFRVEKLTLEVHFVAQVSTELTGGLDLKVVTVGGAHLGGKHTYQDQQIHMITLTLGAHMGVDGAAPAAPSRGWRKWLWFGLTTQEPTWPRPTSTAVRLRSAARSVPAVPAS